MSDCVDRFGRLRKTWYVHSKTPPLPCSLILPSISSSTIFFHFIVYSWWNSNWFRRNPNQRTTAQSTYIKKGFSFSFFPYSSWNFQSIDSKIVGKSLRASVLIFTNCVLAVDDKRARNIWALRSSITWIAKYTSTMKGEKKLTN